MELFKKKEKRAKEPKEPKEKVKKEKRLKKRFSFLELISSVAVLAILGTVGFLVYKNHFKKQIPQVDKELVNQLNQSLNKNFGNKTNLDLTKVIDALEKDGILFSNLKFTDATIDLVYDDSATSFGIYEKGVGVTYPSSIERKESKIDPTLWRFASKNPGDFAKTFSYYLLDGCSGNISVVGGVDVGKNEDISRVSYINAFDKKQTVTIRTNSYETDLIVNETVGDTINHFGRAGKLTVNRLHTDSYHEYGDLKYAYVPNGRVVAESGGNIDVALVTSEVAFLQEKGNGRIQKAYAYTSRAYSGSQKADSKYGNKVQLIYDTNLSSDDNAKVAEIAANEALNKAIIGERIERGLEKHPNAVGYTREGDEITIFDHLSEAVEFYADGRDGVVTLTGSESLSEPLHIKDVNIVFRGDSALSPTISGYIEIEHTSGGHSISFENIHFLANSSKSLIFDHSVCYNAVDVNILYISNCSFDYSSSKVAEKPIIGLAPTNTYIGTQLVLKDCTFKSNSASMIVLSTRCSLDNSDYVSRGQKILSWKKHIVESNTFSSVAETGMPAIIGNYFDAFKNKFINYHVVFSFVPSLDDGDEYQFDVSVYENEFSKVRYLFNVVDLDSIYLKKDFKFNFFGSTSNSFENVKNIGDFDAVTTNNYIKNSINSWKEQLWSGVTDKSIGVSLDRMTMDLEVNDSPEEEYYFTLEDGKRVKAYTQVENDPVNGRTGNTLKDVDGNKYYLYSIFNNEVNLFFKEGTNEAYVSLLGDGDVESLKVKELTKEVDWLDEFIFEDEELYSELKYFDPSSDDKVGAIFKLDETFTTLNGNTYIDSDLIQEDGYLKLKKLSVENPEDEKKVRICISDIGNYSKLVLTNDDSPTVLDGEMVISLPSDCEVILSGDYETLVSCSLDNLILKDRLNIAFDDTSVLKHVEVSGENASGLNLINEGYVEKMVVNSKTLLTNRASIETLVAGEVGERHIEETLKNASGTSIRNNGGWISSLTTYAKTNVTNFLGSNIDNLTVSFVEGYEELCLDTSISNSGTMCNNNGSIYLFASCSFVNYSTGAIGTSTNRNGCIIIGKYGESSAHDGLVFDNYGGNIFSGHLLNESTGDNEVRTFIIYGYEGGKKPIINITSNTTFIGPSNLDESVLIPDPNLVEARLSLV